MDTIVFPSLTDFDSELPLYLTSAGHWDHQERTQRENGYLNYQWLQVLSGTGELIVGEKRFVVKPGQGFFLHPHESHVYQPLTGPWELQWVAFNGSLCSSIVQQASFGQSGVYTLSEPEILIAHMKNLYGVAITAHPFIGMECSKLLYSFLLDLMKSVTASHSSAAQNYTKIYPVLAFIDENVHRSIGIDELAATAGISVQYLCQMFQNTLKMRPMEYVNRERIHKSKQWMFREPALKMQQIASKVGFETPSYFSSVFKKVEGMSPEQFKRFHAMRG